MAEIVTIQRVAPAGTDNSTAGISSGGVLMPDADNAVADSDRMAVPSMPAGATP